jgi:hypothetical protein
MQQRSQSVDAIVDTELFNNHDRPPRRYAQGRECADLTCSTRLSVYNESEYCSLHKVKVTPRVRGNIATWPLEHSA